MLLLLLLLLQPLLLLLLELLLELNLLMVSLSRSVRKPFRDVLVERDVPFCFLTHAGLVVSVVFGDGNLSGQLLPLIDLFFCSKGSCINFR